MKRDLYLVEHTHRFGTSTYLVRSGHLPTIDEVVSALDLDFEPEREGEEITISFIGDTEIVDIPENNS